MPKIFLIKNRLHQQQLRLQESQNLLAAKDEDRLGGLHTSSAEGSTAVIQRASSVPPAALDNHGQSSTTGSSVDNDPVSTLSSRNKDKGECLTNKQKS